MDQALEEHRQRVNVVDKDALLGRLVWYSISDICVSHTDVLRGLTAVGLESHVPPYPKPFDVFRRVSSNAQKTKVPTDQDGIFENYMVREIAGRGEDVVTRRIVVETVDRKGKKLAYVQLRDIEFHKSTGAVVVRELPAHLEPPYAAQQASSFWGYFSPEVPGVKNPHVESITAEIKSELVKWLGKLNHYAIREFVRKFVLKMGATLVREGGGVYFLLESQSSTVDALETFVNGLADGANFHCVSGDTMLHTRTGLMPIQDLVGKPVEIWNGERWSEVEPFFSGNRPLYRVRFSDGSLLDATANHRWQVRKWAHAVSHTKIVTTDQLAPGMVLPRYSLENCEGTHEPHAYAWGHVAGDGNLHTVAGKYKYTEALVFEHQKEMLSSLTDKTYAWQTNPNGKRFCKVNVTERVPYVAAQILRETDHLPDEIFSWDAESLREFFGGWIDTDGEMQRQAASDNYAIYGKEGQLRQAQLLLRRIGVNHASLNIFVPAGHSTTSSLGTITTTHACYRLRIPSHEAGLIQEHVRVLGKRNPKIGKRYAANNAKRTTKTIDRARVQKVVSIERLTDADTFCFTEPHRGMGVFNNVLTHQSLPLVDDLKQRRMVKKAFEAESVDAIDALMIEMQEIMRGDKLISTDKYAAYVTRYQNIMRNTQDYEALLETGLGETKSRLGLFQSSIVGLKGKVKP